MQPLFSNPSFIICIKNVLPTRSTEFWFVVRVAGSGDAAPKLYLNSIANRTEFSSPILISNSILSIWKPSNNVISPVKLAVNVVWPFPIEQKKNNKLMLKFVKKEGIPLYWKVWHYLIKTKQALSIGLIAFKALCYVVSFGTIFYCITLLKMS